MGKSAGRQPENRCARRAEAKPQPPRQPLRRTRAPQQQSQTRGRIRQPGSDVRNITQARQRTAHLRTVAGQFRCKRIRRQPENGNTLRMMRRACFLFSGCLWAENAWAASAHPTLLRNPCRGLNCLVCRLGLALGRHRVRTVSHR